MIIWPVIGQAVNWVGSMADAPSSAEGKALRSKGRRGIATKNDTRPNRGGFHRAGNLAKRAKKAARKRTRS